MSAIGLIIWFALLIVFFMWSDKHSFKVPGSGHHAETTYYPHISHSISWGYVGITFIIVPIFAVETTNGGSLIACLLGIWQMSRAFKLYSAYVRNVDIEF